MDCFQEQGLRERLRMLRCLFHMRYLNEALNVTIEASNKAFEAANEAFEVSNVTFEAWNEAYEAFNGAFEVSKGVVAAGQERQRNASMTGAVLIGIN